MIRHLTLMAIFILSGAGLSSRLQAAQIKLVVTNDVHGHVMANPDRKEIGYALLKGYVERERRAGWTVYLLDSGDVFSGSAYAQVDHGRSVARVLGMMGYRVLTPGNHAFDHNEVEKDPLYYSRVLLKTVREGTPGPFSAVAVNLTRDAASLPGVQRSPVVIHDETGEDGQGIRVVVTGVITPYAFRPSLRDSIPGYDFGRLDDSAATKREVLAALSASLEEYGRPGDVVLVLSHLGYMGPEGDREGRITGPDLAAAANVRFVADSHTHTAIAPRKIGDAWYGNGGHYLDHFLEITVGPDGEAAMVLKGYDDLTGLEPDPELAAWLADLEERQGLGKILFELPEGDLFSDRDLRTDSVPLGRLICRSMQRAAGADFAIHNIGGIRSGLPSGQVTARDLYDVLPFGDDLILATMTGQDIAASFSRGSGHGGRGFPQFFGMTAYAWRGPDGRLRLAGLRDAPGRLIDPHGKYRVAINSIMAKLTGVSGENRGELILAVKRDLADPAAMRLEEVVDLPGILIFPSEREAVEALGKSGDPR